MKIEHTILTFVWNHKRCISYLSLQTTFFRILGQLASSLILQWKDRKKPVLPSFSLHWAASSSACLLGDSCSLWMNTETSIHTALELWITCLNPLSLHLKGTRGRRMQLIYGKSRHSLFGFNAFLMPLQLISHTNLLLLHQMAQVLFFCLDPDTPTNMCPFVQNEDCAGFQGLFSSLLVITSHHTFPVTLHTHSFIQQIFILLLPSARHCSNC